MLEPILFSSDSAEYRVVVLPLPVGPVTSTMPNGWLIASLKSLSALLLEAKLRHVQLQIRLVEEAQDDLFAEHRRQHRDAEIHLLAASQLQLDPPVLWEAALGNVERRHHLDTRGHGILQLERRPHDFFEHAVAAEADAEHPFIRFEMHVAGAALDGVGQDGVDQAHHRRILGGALQLLEIDLLGALEELHVLAPSISLSTSA